MSEEPEKQKSFTSGKLDILDGMSMDPRVTDGEFRIAFRLMQHANGENGAIFPSQERIADQTGKKLRTVRSCIAGLVSKGWLHIVRPNRRISNWYRFDRKHLNHILDRQIVMDEARREDRSMKSRRLERFDRHLDDAQTLLTGNSLPIVSGSQMTVNTLKEHLKDSGSIEEEVNSYAKQAKGH